MSPLGHPEWDEAADALAPLVGEGAAVVLRNSTGDAVDEQRVAERIAAARGAERVTALHVHPSSRVRDPRFLHALPALQSLDVEGLQPQTLEGIGGFQ